MPEIRRAWETGTEAKEELVTAKGKANWGNVRGPVGAMQLCLRRIGWRVEKGFEMRDDLGTNRIIAQRSPKQWEMLLKEATLRNLERENWAEMGKA